MSNYKEILDNFSSYLLGFKKNERLPFIEDKHAENLEIYKRNYLQLCFNLFSKDFPACFKHIENQNFLFLVRQFLLDVGLKNSNIYEASQSFLLFIKNSFSIHQDRILFDLAKIDFIWCYAKVDEIKVYDGMFEYWYELTSGVKSEKKINLMKLRTLKVIEYEGERAFKIIL